MTMDPNDLAAMQAQVLQSMIEHQIVAEALRAVSLACAGFVLVFGLLTIYLMWRLAHLSAGCLEQERRHSAERLETDKRHSLELQSNGMQYLHAFEGIVSAKRKG
jgi:hypothetical protein